MLDRTTSIPSAGVSPWGRVLDPLERSSEIIFSSLDVANRTRAELLRLARIASDEGPLIKIDPAPTHAEIASRISTHREAVTREINRLSKLGIVERRGSSLIVKNIERLQDMVEDAV